MFGATPPRRTTRSSTRNDSDTLCRCSASSWSENLPGKCIRWSVAIDPATRTLTGRGYLTGGAEQADGRTRGQRGPAVRRYGGGFASAAERVAAGAAARGVRVVDREA